MSSRATIWFAPLLLVSACAKKPHTCMAASMPSELVTQAALFRLDVYGANSTCADVGAGSAQMIASKTFAASQPLSLDVAPGHHALVLTSFRDAQGTMLLGSACAEADLRSGTPVCVNVPLTAPDMACPGAGCGLDMSVDMTPMPPDLLGCTQVSEMFAADPSATWTVRPTASFDAVNQRLQLATADLSQAGAAYYSTPIQVPAFEASFDYFIGSGTGEGMAFVWAPATGGIPMPTGPGEGVGYYGIVGGFAVEFDTSAQPSTIHPNSNHIAFVTTDTANHVAFVSPIPSLNCNCWHTARVRFTGSNLQVFIDGSQAINAAVVGYAAAQYYFGFSASTGAALSNTYAVRNFSLLVGTCL